MIRIYNYYKNYSKYYCNPFFLDFAVGKIIKTYKQHKARIYYRTNYRKDSQAESRKGTDSKGYYEDSCEENKSNKRIFNTITKKKINDPSNILEELTLDSNNDFLTYKIEFERERNDLNLSFNFNNFSDNSIISGLVSRISTEECCKNLLDEHTFEKHLKKNLSLDKIENFNLSTNCGKLDTNENEYLKSETNFKTVTTEETERPKVMFTIGKYSARLSAGSDKKKNEKTSVENKPGPFKNIKPSEEKKEKTSSANKINQKIYYLNNNHKKISLLHQQPIKPISTTTKVEINDKKRYANVVASVPKRTDENNININNIKNPELLKSPNDKFNKVIINPLNLACLTGTKQVQQNNTSRAQTSSSCKNQFNIDNNNRNISKDFSSTASRFMDKDMNTININLNSSKVNNIKNSISTKKINFICSNKSVDFKKVINNSSSKKSMISNFNYNSNNNNNTNGLRNSAQIEKHISELDNTTSNDIEIEKVKNPFIKVNSFNTSSKNNYLI